MDKTAPVLPGRDQGSGAERRSDDGLTTVVEHRPHVERDDGGFCIDAALLGNLLNLPSEDVPSLMRDNQITAICERGEGEHDGRFRLTFFFEGRRARLEINDCGYVVARSVIDFGKRNLCR